MSDEFNFYNSIVDDIDCEDGTPPDLRALGFVCELLTRTMGAHVGNMYDGTVRVEWVNEPKRLTLVVGPEMRMFYLYHQNGNDYGTVKTITPAVLTQWLEWLRK